MDSEKIESVLITTKQWISLEAKLKEDYKLSTVIIREKMKRVLGVLPREYDSPYLYDYRNAGFDKTVLNANWDNTPKEKMMYLDFFDKHKKTMFMLKYSEYIQK
jgi:hypothetical protein